MPILDAVFNCEFNYLNTSDGVAGRAYELEMCAIGMGYVYQLNKKEHISSIDYMAVLAVENTQNQGQYLMNNTGDLLFRMQGDEVAEVD